MAYDNFSAYDDYEKEQARREAKLPTCDFCGEPIYEFGYRIKDRFHDLFLCQRCVEECREYVDD